MRIRFVLFTKYDPGDHIKDCEIRWTLGLSGCGEKYIEDFWTT